MNGLNELGFAALCYLALKECLAYFAQRKAKHDHRVVCPLIDHKDWNELLEKTRDIHHNHVELTKVLDRLANASEHQTRAMIKISSKLGG
jgi:hypothetical protein